VGDEEVAAVVGAAAVGAAVVGAAVGHCVNAQLPSGASVSLVPPISIVEFDTTVTVKAAWITWPACAMDVNTLYFPAAGNVTCATSCANPAGRVRGSVSACVDPSSCRLTR